MGAVYRATDSVLGRTVAVKLLSERHAREPEARARFRREALAAARLSSSRNVVTLFDVAEHEGRPLIVMEYVDGGSVHEQLHRGAVPREHALRWLEQTAGALDRAHAAGVVHRDIKPANLLLDRDGNAHVSDFGIASTTGDDTVTLPGTVLGTVGYLSPEQARGEPATPASDRYALGVVAFELLTGRRPFASETATTEILAHLHAPAPSASSFDSALPPAVDGVLVRALAKNPAYRPSTCAALVAELRRALGAEGESVSGAPDTTPIPALAESETPTRRLDTVYRSRRRHAPAVLGLALLVCAAAVAALVAFSDGPEPASSPPTATKGTAAESAAPDRTVRQVSRADGTALNDAGYAKMRAGDFEGALSLLRRAVLALRGTRTLAEAYASYNLAYTRFALGRCDGVLGLLDRSERIQGRRSEIDALRARWGERCTGGDVADQGNPVKGDDPARGKASGKGKGKGNGKGKD